MHKTDVSAKKKKAYVSANCSRIVYARGNDHRHFIYSRLKLNRTIHDSPLLDYNRRGNCIS